MWSKPCGAFSCIHSCGCVTHDTCSELSHHWKREDGRMGEEVKDEGALFPGIPSVY